MNTVFLLLIVVAGVLGTPSPLQERPDRRLGVASGFEKIWATLPVAEDLVPSEPLPVNFEVSSKWPVCANLVNDISNQGNCGSCWAVSTAAVFGDRLCIATNGKDNRQFSADDTMTCCTNCFPDGSNGCNGGYVNRAIEWFKTVGVVSGGSRGYEPFCRPYVGSAHVCTQQCVPNTRWHQPYLEDKRKARDHAFIASNNPSQMQAHLVTHGSISATFEIFDDFYHHYTEGVYVKSANAQSVGWHAVRIIGWGVDAVTGLDYWHVANSWGKGWGMNGFFKIVRGRNECDIEQYPSAPVF